MSARLFNTMAAWLFVVINGHLLLVEVVVASFTSSRSPTIPSICCSASSPRSGGGAVPPGCGSRCPRWPCCCSSTLVLGVISRVAQQSQIFSIGFVATISVGLLGLLLTLPLLQRPMLAVLEWLLGLFQP